MNTQSPTDHDFLAELRFLSAEEGGRSTPAHSGYRPDVRFSFSSFMTCGRQIYLGRDSVNPGNVVNAYIKIISVEVFKNSLQKGTEFKFLEGARIIGHGKILEVMNPDLQKM